MNDNPQVIGFTIVQMSATLSKDHIGLKEIVNFI